MFPTFISILDIQSWWEVPSIAHFCSLFRTAFNLLDFDIEDLEEALLTDGTEETSWLQELIVRLLSGCLPNNEISTFNYQMFLRRLFRQKCQEHDQYNPFNTDVDFQLLPLRTKVDILHALCDFRLDADDVLDQLKNLEADSLRVEPLGYDCNESAYWYFYGTRLYREDFNTKNNKKKSVWQVICFSEDDWFQLNKKFKKSTSKCERQLYRTLTENFLPELPRLFREKERLARKRLLESQPRRTSNRLKKSEDLVEKESLGKSVNLNEDNEGESSPKRKQDSVDKKESKGDKKDTDSSEEERDDMAGNRGRPRKVKTRQRKSSENSSHDKESKVAKRNPSTKESSKSSTSSSSTTATSTTTVGRQTNNSLAAATGQIVIQPLKTPLKKKLKTSQVFRQTDEDLLVGMHKILDYVKSHEDAWPFADPVDEEYAPNYYTVIRRPMDLQRMEDRLDSGYYTSYSKFRDDFQLIVDNCRLYNGVDNEYTEMVDNLLKVFERATDKYLDQISSSDDEIAVEYPQTTAEEVVEPKEPKEKDVKHRKTLSKRKPALSAKTNKRRRSNSEESEVNESSQDEKSATKEKVAAKTTTVAKVQAKESPKEKRDVKNKQKEKQNKEKVTVQKKEKDKHERKSSSRSRSRCRSPSISSPSHKRGYSSSPPPSDASSSPPDNNSRFNYFPKKHKSGHDGKSKDTTIKSKTQSLHDKYKDLFSQESTNRKSPTSDIFTKRPMSNQSQTTTNKPADKHNTLRETIEKLKAKSELSSKFNEDEPYNKLDLETSKENKSRKTTSKHDKIKPKHIPNKSKGHATTKKSEYEDSNSQESIYSEKKGNNKKIGRTVVKEPAEYEALDLATEQTLKDINKWLDNTPKYPEFSSESNSPSYGVVEDSEVASKHDVKRTPKKDTKDLKRRMFTSRDPAKFIKRREVQRTIDRLQPGKGKGNLITTVQSAKQTENDPLFPIPKVKDSKNSLIVKTDDNAPKLSLGTVLDSFGRHKFSVDDKKPAEVHEEPQEKQTSDAKPLEKSPEVVEPKEEVKVEEVKEVPKEEEKETSSMMSSATPNLSAWFKAFGAPKIQSNLQPPPKKSEALKDEEPVKTSKEVALPEPSPSLESPATPHGQPVPRQRKISTGSSVSERSSFSQDMDSPRIGIDERLYPAPYPSPMHRSPSGASPVMASPRSDLSPKTSYPPFNGQMRVGFYQDTVSNKSSPDKSCSPRDNPCSPRENPQSPSYPVQCGEHVYTPNSTPNLPPYSYAAPPYYTQGNYPPPNAGSAGYLGTSPAEQAYYDTSKSLTDQYQAKSNFAEEQKEKLMQQQQQNPTVFPVKKRVYNDAERYSMLEQHQEQLNAMQNLGVGEKQVAEQQQRALHQNSSYHGYNAAYGDDLGSYQASDMTAASAVRNLERKLDLSKYTNMGYAEPGQTQDGGHFQRGIQQYNRMDVRELNAARPDIAYTRPPSSDQHQSQPTAPPPQQQQSVPYKTNMDMTTTSPSPLPSNHPVAVSAHQQIHNAYNPNHPNSANGMASGVVSMPRPTYNTLDVMDQHLALRGNGRPPSMANLSHIVDRYNNNSERMMASLQSPPDAGQYYEKGLGGRAHMFNKPICSSAAASGLALFNHQGAPPPTMQDMQAYNQNVQNNYNRQQHLAELQSAGGPAMVHNNAAVAAAANKSGMGAQQERPPAPEKKTKKRKSSKAAQAALAAAQQQQHDAAQPPPPSSNLQGFHSYAELKPVSSSTSSTNTPSSVSAPSAPSSIEPGAISLKTASVVPGSAFNFGPPPPAGLGIYGPPPTDNHHASLFDDFRAHHQSPAFMGGPPHHARPPTNYGLGGAFMATPQAAPPLMDATSPLYNHYLQAGVLNQGLLPPPAQYPPPNYHPLSMRQPYDSMTRPPWL